MLVLSTVAMIEGVDIQQELQLGQIQHQRIYDPKSRLLKKVSVTVEKHQMFSTSDLAISPENAQSHPCRCLALPTIDGTLTSQFPAGRSMMLQIEGTGALTISRVRVVIQQFELVSLVNGCFPSKIEAATYLSRDNLGEEAR